VSHHGEQQYENVQSGTSASKIQAKPGAHDDQPIHGS